MTMARMMPHCLKQYGMDNMATPMMELARVITEWTDIVWQVMDKIVSIRFSGVDHRS